MYPGMYVKIYEISGTIGSEPIIFDIVAQNRGQSKAEIRFSAVQNCPRLDEWQTILEKVSASTQRFISNK